MTVETDIQGKIQELAEQFAGTERDQSALDKVGPIPISPAAVRSHVTRLLVWSFVIYLFLAAIYWTVGEEHRASAIVEIGKTLFFPLVTFVIGHYFGSKGD